MTGMVSGLGASPTVVSFGELYTALSSGVVDGAEQPIANYQSNKFYEVART
jgi:TRAP-type C4-dicarboxylate transport system substrate-binding protein